MHRLKTILTVALVLLVAASAACNEGATDAEKTASAVARGGTTPAPIRSVGASPTQKPAAGGAESTPRGQTRELTITAKDFSFDAPDATLSRGDVLEITFINAGAVAHTLTFYSDDAFTRPIAGADTGPVNAGASKPLSVVAQDGLYYRCTIHPTQMQGEIEIK